MISYTSTAPTCVGWKNGLREALLRKRKAAAEDANSSPHKRLFTNSRHGQRSAEPTDLIASTVAAAIAAITTHKNRKRSAPSKACQACGKKTASASLRKRRRDGLSISIHPEHNSTIATPPADADVQLRQSDIFAALNENLSAALTPFGNMTTPIAASLQALLKSRGAGPLAQQIPARTPSEQCPSYTHLMRGAAAHTKPKPKKASNTAMLAPAVPSPSMVLALHRQHMKSSSSPMSSPALAPTAIAIKTPHSARTVPSTPTGCEGFRCLERICAQADVVGGTSSNGGYGGSASADAACLERICAQAEVVRSGINLTPCNMPRSHGLAPTTPTIKPKKEQHLMRLLSQLGRDGFAADIAKLSTTSTPIIEVVHNSSPNNKENNVDVADEVPNLVDLCPTGTQLFPSPRNALSEDQYGVPCIKEDQGGHFFTATDYTETIMEDADQEKKKELVLTPVTPVTVHANTEARQTLLKQKQKHKRQLLTAIARCLDVNTVNNEDNNENNSKNNNRVV